MQALWISVALLAFVVALLTVAVVALVRQVGLLHLRVRPLQALEGEDGPRPGQPLVINDSHWQDFARTSGAELVVLAFISPTCSLCTPLLPAFASVAKSLEPRERLALVFETSVDSAERYLAKQSVMLPFFSAQDAFRANGILGAPFVAVVDDSGYVLASGGVNTGEQIDYLVDKARLATTIEHVESLPIIHSQPADASLS